MRKLLFFFFLISSSCPVLAQAGFQKLYMDLNAHFSTQAGTPTSDGGMLLTGVKNVGPDYLFLLKTDSSGEISWVNKFPRTGQMLPVAVRQSGNAYAVLVNNMPASMILLLVDSAGNKKWAHEYAGMTTGSTIASGLLCPSSGGFLLLGGNGQDIFIIRTNASGSVQWTKSFGFTNAFELGTDAVEMTGGDFIVLSYFQPNGGYSTFILSRLNLYGDILWSKLLNCSLPVSAHHLALAADGGILMNGSSHSQVPNLSSLVLMKANSAGVLQWSRLYSNTTAGTTSATALALPDGSFMVSGELLDSSQAFLMKVNSAGDTVWSRGYYYTNLKCAAAAVQSHGNGFDLCGSLGNIGSYIIRTDSVGRSNCSTSGCPLTAWPFSISSQDIGFGSTSGFIDDTLSISMSSSFVSVSSWCPVSTMDLDAPSFSVYPNPFSSTIEIDLEYRPEKKVSLSVINVLGDRITFQDNAFQNDNTVQLTLENLPAGIYFLELVSNGNRITRKLVKI